MSLINAAAYAMLPAALIIALHSGQALMVLGVATGAVGAIAVSGQAPANGRRRRS